MAKENCTASFEESLEKKIQFKYHTCGVSQFKKRNFGHSQFKKRIQGS